MGGLGATLDAGLAVPEGGGTTLVPARPGLPHLCQPDRGCDDQDALLLSHQIPNIHISNRPTQSRANSGITDVRMHVMPPQPRRDASVSMTMSGSIITIAFPFHSHRCWYHHCSSCLATVSYAWLILQPLQVLVM